MSESPPPIEQHVTVLGVLYMVFGAMGVVAAMFLGILFGGAAAVVGVISRSEPEAAVAVPILGTLGGLLFLVVLIFALPELAVGIGLVKRWRWARVGGLVLSVLNLLKFPLGTALGVYGLWVLLDRKSEAVFH